MYSRADHYVTLPIGAQEFVIYIPAHHRVL